MSMSMPIISSFECELGVAVRDDGGVCEVIGWGGVVVACGVGIIGCCGWIGAADSGACGIGVVGCVGEFVLVLLGSILIACICC